MIRPLTVEEIPDLMPLAETAYREIYKGEMVRKVFLSSWIPLVEKGFGEILLAHQGDDIEGLMGYVYQDNMFTGAQEVSVQFIYVLPHHRGNRVLDEFLTYLEGLEVSRIELSMKGRYDYHYLTKKGYEPDILIYGKDLP